MYENKNILILGAARSGISVAKILSKNNNVVLTDITKLSKENNDLLESLNVKSIITKNQEELDISKFDVIVKNPGISPSHPLILKADELSVPVINEMEVAFTKIPSDTYVIGITGSNGKTTTVSLIYEFLKAMGKDVILGGNIGIPLCDIVESIKKDTILLLEISDHQLLNLSSIRTNLSAITNIYKTHLDYHKTFDNYIAAKKRIYQNCDKLLVNKTNEVSLNAGEEYLGNKIYFNDESNYITDTSIYINNELLIDKEDILLVGSHNYENILLASLVVSEFNLDKEAIKKVLSNFKGVEHRIEYVNTFNEVKFYNDSKATNPTSTITALKTFNKNIHLILGGQEQNHDFEILKNDLSNVTCIYAIGETEYKIKDFALKHNKKVIVCNTLKNAVDTIFENINKDEIVLLSPASASFDQYNKFEDRGNEFKKCVNDYILNK